MPERVAVVTGSNKGIGYACVLSLARKFDGVVYLTSRNVQLGQEALAKAKSELGEELAKKLRYHQLDITDIASIHNLRDTIRKDHGRLDVLVNNAARIFHAATATETLEVQARLTQDTNYYGLRNVCKTLFPLLVANARVVNVVSRVGTMQMKTMSEEVKAKFTQATSEDQVTELVESFVKSVGGGSYREDGWPDPGRMGFGMMAYGISKLASIVLTELQQKQLASDADRPGILANSVCPGFVDTDMSNHLGAKSVEEGADSLLFLSLLTEGTSEPAGRLVYERKWGEWRDGYSMWGLVGSMGGVAGMFRLIWKMMTHPREPRGDTSTTN